METTQTISKIPSTGAMAALQEQQQKEAEPRPAPTRQANLEEVVKRLSDAMSTSNMQLSFSTDSSSGKVIVRVTDTKTGQVIRQIPSEDVLRIAKNIQALLGILYDHSV
jgi:flagellar protein FlaG